MNAAAIVVSGNDADSSNPTRGSRKKFIGIGCDIAGCRSIGPLPPLIYEMTVDSNDAESMHLVSESAVGGGRAAGGLEMEMEMRLHGAKGTFGPSTVRSWIVG